ncbi:S41 family peptidase [Candidatus Kuenenbacteria bacterium]|nr:S41 family peptidase [Candidatus Kuenenbacteria bacterium]
MITPENTADSGAIKKSGKFFSKSLNFYILAAVLIVVFAGGFALGKKESKVQITNSGGVEDFNYGEVKGKDAETPPFLGKDVNFKLFWDVWNKIQEKYVDRPVGETKLMYGAMAGLVASLDDPFSGFMEPKTATDFEESLAGRFEGIGAEIAIRHDVLTVVSPLPESPAEKAGVLAGDVIMEIDGYKTEKIDINDAVNRIRGEKGTTVNLKIYRQKENKILDIPVVRDVIKIVSVSLQRFSSEQYPELGDKKIDLVKVTNFNADTEERFRQIMVEVGKDNPDGLILDLRSNPGGYLDTAIMMANAWVDQGKVVVTEKFVDDKKMHLASEAPVLNKFRTVVLVNGGSASGSEIVAGALQDHGLATLVGEKTFGKGSVQELENLDDGSAIKITIARWLTPKGRTIDKEGIEPDIKVELTSQDFNDGKDPQLDRAIKFLLEGK